LLWKSFRRIRRRSQVSPTTRSWALRSGLYCPEHKLAIEIQGGVHEDVLRCAYDEDRQAWLEVQGIRVLSFDNRDLLESLEYVVGMIRTAVRNRT
jgi:very-short-patch-repair endonuclease